MESIPDDEQTQDKNLILKTISKEIDSVILIICSVLIGGFVISAVISIFDHRYFSNTLTIFLSLVVIYIGISLGRISGYNQARKDYVEMLVDGVFEDNVFPLNGSAKKASTGRPPASWWPAFSEELAIYIHDNGLPATQEALITSIQTTMTLQGKEEPSRSQIQPVIRAIFARERPAGNS